MEPIVSPFFYFIIILLLWRRFLKNPVLLQKSEKFSRLLLVSCALNITRLYISQSLKLFKNQSNKCINDCKFDARFNLRWFYLTNFKRKTIEILLSYKLLADYSLRMVPLTSFMISSVACSWCVTVTNIASVAKKCCCCFFYSYKKKINWICIKHQP